MPTTIASTLALAVVESSTAPLLLLDGDCRIVAVSNSFSPAFGLPPAALIGRSLFELGDGEWNVPRLRSLLAATLSGGEAVPAYEIDLVLPGRGQRRLVLNARRLVYTEHDAGEVRLLLAVADVTDARASEQIKDDLLREKVTLLQEIQHRVANSLQIIASVLLQSARKVGSEETRKHLRDAHGRVLAIAQLQRHLAEAGNGDVAIGSYLDQLCQSLGASMIDDTGRIVLTSSADGSRVTANASVSIGLVVTELVINALKHAFPDGRRGGIIVDYHGEGRAWTLSVGDDGIGMAHAGSGGLGTSIVNALAKHLRAEVTVTDAEPGTIVALTHSEDTAGDPAPELEEAAL